jgi:hypothetical protein
MDKVYCHDCQHREKEEKISPWCLAEGNKSCYTSWDSPKKLRNLCEVVNRNNDCKFYKKYVTTTKNIDNRKLDLILSITIIVAVAIAIVYCLVIK